MNLPDFIEMLQDMYRLEGDIEVWVETESELEPVDRVEAIPGRVLVLGNRAW